MTHNIQLMLHRHYLVVILFSLTLFVSLGVCENNYLRSDTTFHKCNCCQTSTEQSLSVLSSLPSVSCQLHMTANSPNMPILHIYTLLD